MEKTMYGTSDQPYRTYTTFDFFKGFLKASLIIDAIILVPGLFMVSIATFLDRSGTSEWGSEEEAWFMLILVLLGVFAIIHFIGGIVARRRKDAYDREVKERLEYEQRRNRASYL